MELGDRAATGPRAGDAWNGFEWVTVERYEEQRMSTMPHLPPLQGTLPAIPKEEGQTFSNLMRRELVMVDLLSAVIGEDVTRGGLQETPSRAVKAWEEWTSGYRKRPEDILKVFEDGAENCDEMVVVQDIPVYSHCEHHLAPIFGTATVGYLPDKKIVGLSKLNRLVDMYARRLQVQERMTNQIANALMTHLAPRGVGVVIKARHFCMESRGVKQTGSVTTTSAMLGAFREDATVRSEFLNLSR